MKRIVLLVAVLATFPIAVIPAAGQDPGDEPDLRLKVKEIPLDRVDRELVPALADPSRQVSVIVELAGDPVAVKQGEALEAGASLTAGQESQVAQDLESAQDALAPAINKLGGQVRSQFQQAYNGMAVRVPAGQLEALAALPGVVGVHSVQILKPTNVATNQLLQTPTVWGDLGFTGKGVKVGIIDSGIDYYHANFGGSGVAADYRNDDRTVIEPGTFPTAKVVGGLDFVGDAFDPLSDDPARNTPNPDPDPLDCGGHGSQMAGTVAGQGVLVNRSTYTGPYDNSTFDQGFLVGPGVAPEAKLYSLKVHGCNLAKGTSTDMILEAIDWSVAHHLDVINLSLGGALGRPDDASAEGATNAARAGVVVVASAGNDGAGPYTLSAPASGKGAIAVGAVDTFQGFDVVEATTSTDTFRMLNLRASPRLPVSGPLRVFTDDNSTPRNESNGCAASDYSAVQPGDIVAVRGGGPCTIADLTTLATQAGAAAVIRINPVEGLFVTFGSQAGAIPILGANLADEAKIVAAAGSTVSIEDVGLAFNPDFGAIASFSASGPRNGDNGLKPDVVAPGLFIASTGMGTGYQPSGVLEGIGTSPAAAFVSGMAALVRQARPKWRATEVKAAIINNAVPLGGERRPTSGGSGLPIPGFATGTEVVAMGDRFGGGLSYGFVESTQPVADTQKITITNHSDRAATYTLSPEWSTDIAQPTMTFSQDTVTVPARERATVDVTLRVDPRLVPGGDNPGVLARQPAMVAGNVVLSTGQEGELGLRVPFSAVVRGTSSIATTPKAPRVADQVAFTSTNGDGVAGPIDVFAWGLSDRKGDARGIDVVNVGFQSRPGPDLGIFAIHSANTESNPSADEWDIMLNTDSDEEPDYAIVGRDAGLAAGDALTGTSLVAETVNLETNKTVRAFSAITQLNSGIVMLPFQLSDVGLAAGAQEEFSYTAGVVSLEEGRGEDLVDGVARFNAFRQPVETGQFNVAFPGAPAQWTAAVDREQLAKTPVKGWLAVYRFNRGGFDQAQPIALR